MVAVMENGMSKTKKVKAPTVRSLTKELVSARQGWETQRDLAATRSYQISKLEKELEQANRNTRDAEDSMCHLRAAITAYALAVANPLTAADTERLVALQNAITGNRVGSGGVFNPHQFR